MFKFENEEDIRILLLEPLNIFVSSTIIIDSGRRMVRELIIRFGTRNGRLDMVRDQNQKSRNCLRRRNGPNEFKAMGLRGSSMILKMLKSYGLL